MTLAIWWLSQHDFAAMNGHAAAHGWPKALPEWLRGEYQSALGRNGRGRLWISPNVWQAQPGTNESPMVKWPETALSVYLESYCAGIVIPYNIVPLLSDLPGIVTDMNIRRWSP